MAAPPTSTKTSLQQRLSARARERWPQLAGVDVRFRGAFAYVTATMPDGDSMPLMRLRYGGSAARWGFAVYLASKDGYEDSRPAHRRPGRRTRRRPRYRLRPLPGRPDRLDMTPDELTGETTKLAARTSPGDIATPRSTGRAVLSCPMADGHLADPDRTLGTDRAPIRAWSRRSRRSASTVPYRRRR